MILAILSENEKTIILEIFDKQTFMIQFFFQISIMLIVSDKTDRRCRPNSPKSQ
jgi:hypothetical protein